MSYLLSLLALDTALPIFIEKIGLETYKRVRPASESARKRAVDEMANELGNRFPSVNFLNMNFKFDTPEIKGELSKNMQLAEIKNIESIKTLMVEEVLKQRVFFDDPEIISTEDASLIVDCFLNHFESECLQIPELAFLTLAGIIRTENVLTRSKIDEANQSTREFTIAAGSGFDTLDSKVDEILKAIKNPIQNETIHPVILTQLEESYVKRRDRIIDELQRWRCEGIQEGIKGLAEDAFEVYEKLNKELAASIFRMYGSFILRTTENVLESKKWITLAVELDPSNHKSIGLKAELLCSERQWQEAKSLLDPIVGQTESSLVKVIYAECLYRLSGTTQAKEWLEKQGTLDDELKLNLAIFSIKDNDLDTASKMLEELKSKPYPGPYPYLYSAEVLTKRAHQGNKIQIGSITELNLRNKYELLREASTDLEKSIHHLQIAGRSKKVIANVAVSLCEIYLNYRDSSSAESLLKKHWNVLRSSAVGWFTAAEISLLKRNYYKALIRARKALALSDKENNEMLLRYAIICLNGEHWDECINIINQAKLEDFEETHIKALLQIKSISLYHKGDFSGAEHTVQELKRKFPGDISWLLAQSIGLTQMDKSNIAIELLEREKSNYPTSLELKLRLATLYSDNEDYSNALVILKECADSLKHLRFYEYLAQVALFAKKPDEVLKIVEEAKTNKIHSEKLDHFEAIALAMHDHHQEAVSKFSNFEQHTLTSNDYLLYAYSLHRTGFKKEAIDLLVKAKELHKDDLRIVSSLALLLHTTDPRRAFEEAQSWLTLEPENKAAYFFAMQLGFSIGESKIANEVMMSYLSRFGEGPEFRHVTLDEVISIRNSVFDIREKLWKAYQDGNMPEIVVSHEFGLGCFGFRVYMYDSHDRIMAFDGSHNTKTLQIINMFSQENIVIDYHALIDLFHFGLIDEILELGKKLYLPQIVRDTLTADISKLKLSYQVDLRDRHRNVLEKLKNFTVHSDFAKIDTLDPTIGNSVFDVMESHNNNCSYVVPGFDNVDLSVIKGKYNIDYITILDFMDLMKENGFISVNEYESAIDILSNYKLERKDKLTTVPAHIMIDWQSLLFLEECGVLDKIQTICKSVHIGPFSYSVISNYVENCEHTDMISRKAQALEEILDKLISEQQIIVIPREKDKDDDLDKVPGTDYVHEILEASKPNNLTLLTDDLCLNKIAFSEGIKTTNTRALLEVLYSKKILDKKHYLEKLMGIIKTNMFFCSITAHTILEYAEMYSDSMSPDFSTVINTVVNEIQSYTDKVPNQQEYLNLSVLRDVIISLWTKSDKSQNLAMSIFDCVFDVVKTKPILQKGWVEMCILEFALFNELCLGEFLQRLSFRLGNGGIIQDKLKEYLIDILRACQNETNFSLIHSGMRQQIAERLVTAVSIAIPNYGSEIRMIARDLGLIILA